jgi:hypothetical protein
MEKRVTSNFWHLKKVVVKQDDDVAQSIRLNTTTKRVLDELKEMEKTGDELVWLTVLRPVSTRN